MVRITYIDSKDVARTVEAEPGTSVMNGAQKNGIPEIEAECGGACSCASCHVYVEPPWLEKFAPMSRIEQSLLSLLETRRANSRLSCQLKVMEELEGLVVRTPAPVDLG